MMPKTYKGVLKLLIEIAEHGNGFKGERGITDKERLAIGAMIADIQNNLGEMQETLEKFNLHYDSHIY